MNEEQKNRIGNVSAIEFAAVLAHEANRLYCLSIGDDTQKHWEDSPEWQQKSALAGARMIFENPATTPEDSHKSWLAVKESDGWVYGDVKCAESKTHPCMVDYKDLPEEQRMKDEIFGTIVRSVMALSKAS